LEGIDVFGDRINQLFRRNYLFQTKFYTYFSHISKNILNMVPPKNAKVIEFPASTMWFDDNGILCSIAKKVPPQTIEEAKKTMVEFLKITGGKKVCMLSDNTDSPPVNKEMRDYAAEVIPEIAKAIAVLSGSAVGKMAANLFFILKKQPYPVKFFDNEEEAKQWLKQYL
jgi:hypothetical protein